MVFLMHVLSLLTGTQRGGSALETLGLGSSQSHGCVHVNTEVQEDPAVEETFKPSECIDNALLLVTLEHVGRGKVAEARFFAELLIWTVSIIIRASMSVFTVLEARRTSCSAANRFLLFCGLFLFSMHRVREFADLVITYMYFHNMFRAEREREACRAAHNAALAAVYTELSKWSETADLADPPDAALVQQSLTMHDSLDNVGIDVHYHMSRYQMEQIEQWNRITGGRGNSNEEALRTKLFVSEGAPFFVIAVLSFKMIVEACITVGGTWFVMVSQTNVDVILNCLAVTFMSEIDEMMYECFSGKVAKTLLKHQPEQVITGGWQGCLGKFMPMLKMLLLGVIDMTAMHVVKPCLDS